MEKGTDYTDTPSDNDTLKPLFTHSLNIPIGQRVLLVKEHEQD